MAKSNSKMSGNIYKQTRPMSPITTKNGTPAPNSKAGKPVGNKMKIRGTTAADLAKKTKRGK